MTQTTTQLGVASGKHPITSPFTNNFSFASIPQATASVLPAGLTLETLSRDDFSFYSMWTDPLIQAVAERTWVPLHYFRTVSQSELSTKLATAQKGTAFLFNTDGKMITTQTFGATPRPIKTTEEFFDCLANLQRLESKFRLPLLATREMQVARQWIASYALTPVVDMVNQVRSVRMYLREYDTRGFLNPEFEYMQSLWSKTVALQKDSTAGSTPAASRKLIATNSVSGAGPARRFDGRTSRPRRQEPAAPNQTPVAKEVQAKRKELPQVLRDAARERGFCIFYQTDTCEHRPAVGSPHQVQPRNKAKAPFDVLHQCAKCGAKGHGAMSCSNQ